MSRPGEHLSPQAKPEFQKIGQPQEENVNWGHLLKLQQDIQNTKDEYEKAMRNQQKSLYKEELEKMLELDHQKKAMEKLKDENYRKRIEENNREIAAREKNTNLARRQLQTEFYKFGLDNAQSRQEFLRGLRQEEREYYINQWKREEEARRIQDMKEKEIRKHQTEELIDAYNKKMEYQHENRLKEKIEDKVFMEQKVMQSTFYTQDKLRKELLDRIKNGYNSNDRVVEQYKQAYEKRQVDQINFEKNIVDKAAREKIIKDDERYRKMEEKKHHDEFEKQSNNMKMIHDKTTEKLQKKYDEMINEHEQNQKRAAEYQRQMMQEQILKAELREQNRVALEQQIREKQIRLIEEQKLRPVESGMNRQNIDVIRSRNDAKLFESMHKPSSLPGLTFDHNRKRQHDYITKSLIFDNKLMAPLENGKTMFEQSYGKKQEGAIYGDLSHRSRASGQENLNINVNQSMGEPGGGIKLHSDRLLPVIHNKEGNKSISITKDPTKLPPELNMDHYDPRIMQSLDAQTKTLGSAQSQPTLFPSQYSSPATVKNEYSKIRRLHWDRDFNIINNNLKK